MKHIWIRAFGLAFAAAAVVASGAVAQEVIKKTTDDKSGFETQLDEIDLMHQTASQLMSAGQWEEAAAELGRVVAAEPDRLAAWSDMAKCYKELKQWDKAAEAYTSAHKLEPKNLDLLSNLGYTQLNAEQLEPAIETYNKMLVLDVVSYDANVHLGFIFLKAGDSEKAAAYYEKALEGRPDDVQSMGSLAQIYADQGEVDKSIAMYERAIAAAPDDQKKTLRSKLGKSLIDTKNYVKAAEVYAALAEQEPDNPATQFNLGISYLQAKNFKDAIPHLETVIELRPEYSQAYQYLAQCYNGTGQYNSAVTTIKAGLPMTENKAGLYYAWGQALEKMELWDEAMDMFQRIENDPTYGVHAKKQIQRQIDLKKRAQMSSGG